MEATEGRVLIAEVEKAVELRVVADMRRKMTQTGEGRAVKATPIAPAAVAGPKGDAKGGEEEEGEWKEAKNRGVELDKEARLALKEARYAEAATLSKKAADSFGEAISKGYRKGAKYLRACMGMLERAIAAQSGLPEEGQAAAPAKAGGEGAGGGKQGGAVVKQGGVVVGKGLEAKQVSKEEEEARFMRAVEEGVRARLEEVRKAAAVSDAPVLAR